MTTASTRATAASRTPSVALRERALDRPVPGRRAGRGGRRLRLGAARGRQLGRPVRAGRPVLAVGLSRPTSVRPPEVAAAAVFAAAVTGLWYLPVAAGALLVPAL